MMTLFFLLSGALFGFVLSRSGAGDYDYIQGMFLFERFQLYGIIGTAVVLTSIGLLILKRYGRTIAGATIEIDRKPFNRGTIVGSALFGIGWSLTGMCPGPMFVNIGEGKIYALAALAGAVAGAALFGSVYEKVRVPFGLPSLQKTTTAIASERQQQDE